MKISKLFHWLYAFVMFLPIFAIGSAMLISTFNQEAKNEVTPIYRYETNEVNGINDLISGRIYNFKINNAYGNNITYCRATRIINVNANVDYSISMYTDDPNAYITVYQSSNGTFYFQLNGNTTVATLDNARVTYPLSFDIVYQSNAMSYTYFSKSDYNEIVDYQTTIVDSQNVFYDSIDKVTESPLFSWAYNSFLSAPLVYIVTLFSIPGNHVIVQLLSYWLAISIIWLVFDLIMYVPLLFHRWIDKGILE